MSWKNIKEHYRIGHQVHITKAGICIGSPYISDLIVIRPDFEVVAKEDFQRSNLDLARYVAEFKADPAKLRELIETPDTFTASIPVFTYDGGEIIEKRCEALGWPNCTHDGEMQYANYFSADRAEVIEWAKRNADLGIELWRDTIARTEKELVTLRARLATEEVNRAKLEALT